VTAKLTVERYDAGSTAEWNDVVRGARARHFMFERAYMDYHADRFVDASFLVRYRGQPLAAFPASRRDDAVISHGGLTFGGLLAGPRLTTDRAVAALAAIRTALRQSGARRLVYKPVPHIYHILPAEEELFALFDAGARLARRDISAAIPPGTRPAYSEERRRAVAQGRSASLTIGEDDRLEEYMALVTEVLETRHGTLPVHTAAEVRLLAGRFPQNIRLFTATSGGEIVAGVLVYETPMAAHAQYIAVGARGRELRAGDALFDHLLTTIYAQKWFDFGISNERNGALNIGLMRNKEGFGARAIVYDQYCLDLAAGS
jgi:hypothetical protein